ncbi:GNAT family N-acetyltransferase [Liquorilactobacillus nagelii]|uniref:GNAT family N-acetyltransferase n=1 Tax=Liquorilactobacillus nagelii TaxID=82688 RepID=UPI0006F0645B|nr:GNAT family N-acetyltransferase [Liquorilactobacillus nagelii]KRL41536.1 hypothetical protein FD45_GL000791 [Liquorilactobacillus nagelii DSM 13675]QYH54693.1 GNAT family N-acetyltransferase [Liquorilactobacillus nagelii DSM 13675]
MSSPKIEFKWVNDELELWEITQKLILEYTASLGLDLSFQNFSEEIANLKEKYGRSQGSVLLVFVAGQPAGILAFHRFQTNIGELKRLYLKPEFRGHGLGKQLLQQMLTRAQKMGYKFCSLRYVGYDELSPKIISSIGVLRN